MRNRIILHYGELTLKGCNRHDFVKKLRTNVRRKVASLQLDWEVISIHDRMFIEVPEHHDEDIDIIVKQLAEIPGIAWLSKVFWFPTKEYGLFDPKPNLAKIDALVERLGHETYQKNRSFAIRVKRAEKRFLMASRALEIHLATVILKNTEWTNVDLENADQYFYVEISSRGLAVHTNRIKAVGGLPVSATGRVLCLLSGGFDSPIAAHLMAKRGCIIDFIHFTASHIKKNKLEAYKVSRIAQRISEFSGRVRLFLVPYTHFDLALMDQKLDYDLILFRRFMARISEIVAEKAYAQCLVTGDNLGQVASQTMENITSMTKAIDMPILRPLLTYNKEEIIHLSRQLGLFDLSTEPYKDCCALISDSPKTKSNHERLDNIEQTFLSDYDEIIENTMADRQVIVYQFGERIPYE